MSDDNFDVFGDLKKLESVGRLSKDVTITDDIVVTLTTLNAEDDIQSHINCEGLSGSAYIDQNKLEVLCFAITKINNASLDPHDYIGKVTLEEGKDNTNFVHVRQYIYSKVKDNVKNWTKTVVDTLFLHYVTMLSEVEKNAEGIKFVEPIEVVADIEDIEDNVKDTDKVEQHTSVDNAAVQNENSNEPKIGTV